MIDETKKLCEVDLSQSFEISINTPNKETYKKLFDQRSGVVLFLNKDKHVLETLTKKGMLSTTYEKAIFDLNIANGEYYLRYSFAKSFNLFEYIGQMLGHYQCYVCYYENNKLYSLWKFED